MRIGYACLIYGLSGFKFKSCRLSNADESRLMEITESNLATLSAMIDYNMFNRVQLFRISSDVMPLASHPEVNFDWKNTFNSTLISIGEKIKSAGIRVSMHPGQYTVLNSNTPEVVQKSILDLEYHCDFLDSLKLDSSHKIVLHIGGVYGDKASAIERFKSNYAMLSSRIRSRLVIENDEKSYNILDVLGIGEELGIPVVFDNLHHSLNLPVQSQSQTEWIYRAGLTWKAADGAQKIHYSQQRVGGKPGAHSQSIELSEFLEFQSRLKEPKPDIMLEVKDKNLSAIKCINCTSPIDVHLLEREWARYKYLVLYHSQNHYLEIRAMFREYSVSALDMYRAIESAQNLDPSKGNMANAFSHIWGYFKYVCTEKERHSYKSNIEAFENENLDPSKFKKFLYKLSVKYDVKYLLESYFFYDIL